MPIQDSSNSKEAPKVEALITLTKSQYEKDLQDFGTHVLAVARIHDLEKPVTKQAVTNFLINKSKN